jgi:hypothetical protein
VITRQNPLAPLRRTALACAASAPIALAALVAHSSACVPPGNSTPSDAGASQSPATPTAPVSRPSINVMTTPFEDNFDRTGAAAFDAAAFLPSLESGAGEGSVPALPSLLGPAWQQAGTNVWTVENGKVCGSKAHNHGLWLQRTLPVNARIEFDAISSDQDGDIKCEVWGDGRSAATGLSYTNATSYVVIFGGWHNTLHVVARLNEHGTDRKEIKIDKSSDDPAEQPVTAGQVYHFKIERTDGKTIRWSVNNTEYIAYTDPAPLTGMGHDHFGFNDWEAPVCFDNVKVTPLP